MSTILDSAIESVQQASAAFCRFITANDTGKTGAHQAGFYIPKCASSLLFSEPGIRGENKDKMVKIQWQNSFETDSRFIYYGRGTRNEYRVTRFGRQFPFFEDDNVGDLLIITKHSEEYYKGFVLNTDDDIENFFSYFQLSPNESNQLIDIDNAIKPDERILTLFEEFVCKFKSFPETKIMAEGARDCYNLAHRISNETLILSPDSILLEWIDSEYNLFRCFEEKVYSYICTTTFPSIENFIKTANEVLNRRKSRAGKSLEHHLSNIFTHNKLLFEEQAVTEDNKKPDFLFPNAECYHNWNFPTDDLTVLGAKTTCKDRWRQIVTEADRLDVKYLFTLQQGISKNQLKEMADSNVKLVVPQKYLNSFPIEYRSDLLDLKGFISMVKEKQNHNKHITI